MVSSVSSIVSGALGKGGAPGRCYAGAPTAVLEEGIKRLARVVSAAPAHER